MGFAKVRHMSVIFQKLELGEQDFFRVSEAHEMFFFQNFKDTNGISSKVRDT